MEALFLDIFWKRKKEKEIWDIIRPEGRKKITKGKLKIVFKYGTSLYFTYDNEPDTDWRTAQDKETEDQWLTEMESKMINNSAKH